ncbi:prolyl-tRNA synthetase associated domain-containing protein [Pseudomonas sp. TE21394]
MQVDELYELLHKLNIGYEKVEHPALGAIADFHEAGIVFPGQNVKCLFLRNRKATAYFLLIVDELKSVDLSELSSHIGVNKLSLASPQRLMDVMGMMPGAVSPFALVNDQQRLVTVLIDDALHTDDLVGFHPLVNTETLCIQYADLLKFLDHTGHAAQLVKIKELNTD